ncbi:hypothetical protein X777_01772 [Ooceraea biroi]|uniref:Uncharacterized protein n=1 Tax=Ooceraea biroi TaxID=2015173 RepID=A0A026WNE5_OOCBI|nr:hypothetical protein X777_01772 [Ooceraea biroi]
MGGLGLGCYVRAAILPASLVSGVGDILMNFNTRKKYPTHEIKNVQRYEGCVSWTRARSYPATTPKLAKLSPRCRIEFLLRHGIRCRTVPRKKWCTVPQKSAEPKRPIGPKSGHSYPAVILGDGDVADRVYLSSCDSSRAEFRTPEMRGMQRSLYPSSPSAAFE